MLSTSLVYFIELQQNMTSSFSNFRGSERLLLFFHHDAHEITVNISFDDARLCTCIELNGSA